MVTIRTDEHGRDYYVDGRAVTKPITIRDWRFLWFKKRQAFFVVGWKPIRVYIDEDE